MADIKKLTGSRDDLVVDASRCLRMRFSESRCLSCVDICPQRAMSLDECLTINPDHCSACLLCTSACPVGAVEQVSSFSDILVQLSRVPDPVLGCLRTTKSSNATSACLGGLSEEHLVALCHTLSGKLTLNISLCSNCPNSEIVHHLQQRIEFISEAGLLEGGCSIATAESGQDIDLCNESVNRRSFFNSIRKSLFQTAAILLSNNNEQTVRHSEYAGKRLPIRRGLLNEARNKLSIKLAERLGKQFDSSVSFNETCTMCLGCVAICPTGALTAVELEETPTFDYLLCTGCQLCSEFCLDKAVNIYKQPKLLAK